ncbi:unnamed protein product [Gadus morhua 'NCC']
MCDTDLHRLLPCQTLQQGENVLGCEAVGPEPFGTGTPWNWSVQETSPGPRETGGSEGEGPVPSPCTCLPRRSAVCTGSARSLVRQNQGARGDQPPSLVCAQLVGYMSDALKLADLPFSYTGDHRDVFGPLVQEQPPRGRSSLTRPLVRRLEAWLRSSPVATLPSSTLSLYYIITSLVPPHFPELNVLKKLSLKIHVTESHREFQTLLAFWALSALRPHMTFELTFVGEGLLAWSHAMQIFMQKKFSILIFLMNIGTAAFFPDARYSNGFIFCLKYKSPRSQVHVGHAHTGRAAQSGRGPASLDPTTTSTDDPRINPSFL